MMTDQQRTKVTALKAAVAASATTRDGAPWEVRAAVVALRRELRQAGMTAGSVAEALEVHVSTLCRWERDVGRGAAVSRREGKGRDRSGGFRMVKVGASTATPLAPRPATPASAPPKDRGLRVAHAPSGLVVDGLDVETLAVLLRRMS